MDTTDSLSDLCKYKDILGKPGLGLHQYRIGPASFNVALVDLLLSILLGLVITKLTNLNIVISMIVVFGIGIAAHRIFCVRTTVDKLLFP